MSIVLGMAGGLILLAAGAEALVRGASKLALACGISPLVVGLTVVAFGTSSPEMAVSVKSALTGQTDLAAGNVVGSNIFNVLFILGLSALVAPLVVAQQLIRFDVWVMVAVSVLAFALSWDGGIGRGDGLLLLAGIVAYTAWLIYSARRESKQAVKKEYEEHFAQGCPPTKPGYLVNGVLVIVGLGLLVFGARLFVAAAVDLARVLGMSELVIGLTIVAAGTSLPEVAASVVASLKGERDIAVGNVVGSNTFNILSVLGASAVVAKDGVAVSESLRRFDLPVMIAVTIACLPIFFTGNRINRWEGLLFLSYYAAYVLYLILAAQEHDALPTYRTAMVWFVIPLTVVTLLVILAREFRVRASAGAAGNAASEGASA